MSKMPTIVAQEGEAFTFTWTVKRAGVVVNLTGKTITINARDKDAVPGTLRIAAQPCTNAAPTTGVTTYTFSTANLAIVESTEKITHVDGEYSLSITGGGETWKTPRGKFVIDRDPMIAAT